MAKHKNGPRRSELRDAVIVEAVRTPIGRRGGALAHVHPVDLAAHVLDAVTDRTGVDPGLIEDVIFGCVSQVGEQSLNVARSAVLAAGWPEEIPATTIDRQCGSSQQAVHFAAAGVMSGQYDMVVAGGVESMTRVPMFSNRGDSSASPRLEARYDGRLVEQGVSAEIIASKWGLSRQYLDELSLTSHQRAGAAIDSGRFTAEITPVGAISADECVRRTSDMERLAALPAVFQDDGVVTAGNSSQIADGAAALLITTSENAERLGLHPLARLHAFSVVGVDPITMLTGPVPATYRALERARLGIDDIDVFEINEAFASVLGVWLAETGVDPRKVNPSGGAIALGHPLGASGARLMTTLVHHMVANHLRFGLQAICEGAGMANATVLELL